MCKCEMHNIDCSLQWIWKMHTPVRAKHQLRYRTFPSPLKSSFMPFPNKSLPSYHCSDFFHHRLVLPVLTLQINGIIRYVLFCILSFIHVVASTEFVRFYSSVVNLFCEHTKTFLSIFLSMDTWASCSFWQIFIKLVWKFLNKSQIYY